MAQVLQGPSRVLEWPDRHGLTPVILIRPLKSAALAIMCNSLEKCRWYSLWGNEKEINGKKHLGPHEVYAATSIMMPPIRQMFIHVH